MNARPREQSEARSGPNAPEIEAALRLRVDSLVPELLKSARPDGAYWSVGSVADEPGTQMKINRRGARQGLWTDFSAAEGSDDHSGDMLMLIAAVRFGGWSAPGAKKSAIAWAKSWLGWDDLPPGRLATIKRETRERAASAEAGAAEETDRKRHSARMLWKGAVPIKGTPAQTYLEGRGIDFAKLGRIPGSLRYLPDCWCPVRRSKHPAMIACIMALDGSLVGVHRTFLDVSGGKGGPVTVVKLPPDARGRRKSHKLSLGPYAGGCIPLWKGESPATLREIPAGMPVHVSEGIEDGLTVALALPSARIVAGVALANMGGLALPPQAGPLIFVGQLDPVDGKAVEAFERAIARQQQAAVQDGSNRKVQVIWPEPGFKDFNDQLRGIRMAEAQA